MKPHPVLLLLALAGSALAQELIPRVFEHPGTHKRNEVTVILDDVVPISESTQSDTSENGKTPEELPAPPPESSEKGVTVSVIDVAGGSGPIDPKKVKLLFPYAPKPLSNPPPGWKFETPKDVPPFVTEVELAPGARVSLNIRPHVLLPIADGAQVFELGEPGFNAAQGYHQTGTVTASLATAIVEMEKNTRQMDQAIERLQQLLASLPPTDDPPSEESTAEEKSASSPSEKR